MPFIDTATGAHLHYVEAGSGTPVIALHGRFGTAHSLQMITDWLSDSYRVLAVTLRGYGDSTPKPRDYPRDFYHRDARDVIAFMDALGIERAHLLGFSDGGETALAAAGLAPDRFLSVAVWGAVGYFGEDIRPVIQASLPADWVTDDMKRLHGITDPTPIIQQWVDACLYMLDHDGDVSISLAPNVTAPVLLMLGDQDRLNPQAFGQRYVDALPNGSGRVVMFGTGHSIHKEDWDGFQRVVGAFLRNAEKQRTL